MLRREKAAVLAKGAGDKAAAEKGKETGSAVGSEASEANVAGVLVVGVLVVEIARASLVGGSLGGRLGRRRSTRPRSSGRRTISSCGCLSCPRNADCTARSSRAVPACVPRSTRRLGALRNQRAQEDLRSPCAVRAAGADHRRGGRHRARRRVHVLGLALEDAYEGRGGSRGEEEDKSTAKREAIAAAVAAAGLTESDLEGAPDASGSAGFLMGLLRHLADNGHRTLVFSQSRCMLDVLERAARADGHELVRIDGQVPPEESDTRGWNGSRAIPTFLSRCSPRRLAGWV